MIVTTENPKQKRWWFMKSLVDTSSGSIELFRNLMTEGIVKIVEACKVYVKEIDSNPDMIERFREECPDIDYGMWAKFERIGRGTMVPQLLYESGMAFNRLALCSIAEQIRYIDSSIEVLNDKGDRLKIQWKNLTPPQLRQVISYDVGGGCHVRSASEQKAFIESQKTIESMIEQKEVSKAKVGTYKIVGKSLFVRKDTTIPFSQLVEIIRQMKSAKKGLL